MDKKQIIISNKSINISYLLQYAMKDDITSSNPIKNAARGGPPSSCATESITDLLLMIVEGVMVS